MLDFLKLKRFSLILVAAGIGFANSSSSAAAQQWPGQVTSLPGLGQVQGLQLAGNLSVTGPAKDSKAGLFFWFVASANNMAEDPIVVWINGGPGSSSLYGFFVENGPYEITPKGEVKIRQHAWSARTNYLMIEQATTVGLSYAPAGTKFKSEDEATSQFHVALQDFFSRYPQLSKNKLYLAGQSYAGKFLPQVAKKIVDANKSSSSKPKINLHGMMIGNGWVNPLAQQSSDAAYAFHHGLIDENTAKRVDALYQECAQEIRKGTPSSRKANELCGKMQSLIREASGIADSANIAKTSQSDQAMVVDYLNRKDVRQALNVHPAAPKFEYFSSSFEKDMEIGVQDSVADLYPALAQAGVEVLIYSGLNDSKDCNFLGTEIWLGQLEWPGKKAFQEAKTCIWRGKDKDVAGYVKSANGITYAKIRNAGHIAPTDQPENVYDMVVRFVEKRNFCE